MTTVTVYRDDFTLKAEGHAGFKVGGMDPICAAISTATQAYGFIGTRMDDAGMTVRPTAIDTGDGALHVRVYPRGRYTKACTLKLDTVIEMLMMIADQYPENLCLNVR